MILKIGSRRCRLARAQAETAGKALAAHYPGLEIQTVEIVTFGDRVWDRPMGSIGGNEIFVDALERELNEYGIDIAVHSADELPAEMGEGLEIAGVLPRVESGEVLVTRSTAEFSRKNRFLVGTESLRRRRNLSKFYPKAEFTDISGNAETRLLKLADRQCDAIILRAEEAALLADQLDGFRGEGVQLQRVHSRAVSGHDRDGMQKGQHSFPDDKRNKRRTHMAQLQCRARVP